MYDASIHDFELVVRSHTRFGDSGRDGTHAEVFRVPRDNDDLMVESNFHVLLARLQSAEDTGIEDDISQDVWDTVPAGPGPLDRIIVVRVKDEAGEFTPAFRVAWESRMELMNGVPYLDEDDWTEREDARFDREVLEFLGDMNDDPHSPGFSDPHRADSADDRTEIQEAFLAAETLGDCQGQDCGHATLAGLESLYEAVRNTMFLARAQRYL